MEADRIEVLLEIGESRRVLTIDKDHLVFSVENVSIAVAYLL